MSALLLLALLGAAGWAFTSARRRAGPGDDLGWKTRPLRAGALGHRSFPNRPLGWRRARVPLLPVPFRPGDLVRVDGEWYHLPTLRRLHHAGRLAWGSAGWRALEGAGRREAGRLD